ncbi:hypothetical protein KYI07_11860 (plasmid) [Macrococcus psychrotolerans]|uniref:CD-NTase-associated protein 15 domain-containing protein n=2 Tax=Staphylococcaceae TaxID=90964 RepID=A0AAT9P838_9STAP|nr:MULTISPECIES: hypothetical protein [Macrococcus]QYA34108.1 hypothetical protein KYI10_11980 [Macrococcus sp. 19Msa1099]QYA38892.1 hypothetical protein KYI07_11860 [Macrococcus caseolyticus]QYA77615.1 hypothetical protein KYI12_11950 [Macrococcus caseolyticus]
MHKYSKLELQKQYELGVIFLTLISYIISVCISPLIDYIIKFLKFMKFPPNFNENINLLVNFGIFDFSFTPIIVFWFLYYLFDKYLWKWKIIVMYFKIPSIEGYYYGSLKSSYIDPKTNEKKPTIEMNLTVKQDFNNISFICNFPNTPSTSKSRMAALEKYENNVAIFEFAYYNQSEDIDIESTSHYGYNRLYFNTEDGTVRGSYFNNRGVSPNKGIINLKKSSGT